MKLVEGCKACESYAFHDPEGLAGEVRCGVCGRLMSRPTEPVFALQSVPGWEYERRTPPRELADPYDQWVSDGRYVRLHADGRVAVAVGGARPLTAEQARQLTTLFAMVAAELERREKASGR